MWEELVYLYRQFLDHIKRWNYFLLFLQLIILGLSVVIIYGIGQACGGGLERYWIRQLLWIGIGIIAMFIFAFIDYRRWGEWIWIVYGVCVLMLVLVLIVGKTINGAKSWLMLAPGVYLQPAEFAKIGVSITLAKLLSYDYVDLKKWSWIFVSLLVLMIPVTLVLLQPDVGSALVFFPIAGTILFIGGIRWRIIIATILFILVAIPISYRFIFKYHQRQRLLIFIKPFVSEEVFNKIHHWGNHKEEDPRRIVLDDWNVRQSELAISSGKIYGKGLGKGTQHTLGYLPRKVAPTDFIFSVVGEELGYLGTTSLLILYLLFLLTCLHISLKAPDYFGMYLACALVALFFVHIFINIGMTVRMAPVIGIPLPFMSYGGSGILSMMMCTGLLQSIYVHHED